MIILCLYIFGGYIGGLEDFSNYGDKLATTSPDDKCNNPFDEKAVKALKADDPDMAKKCAPYWGAQMKLKLFTYILCTFVFMQVFNYINCRKIGAAEINVFERMFTKINWYFWLTIAFISVV